MKRPLSIFLERERRTPSLEKVLMGALLLLVLLSGCKPRRPANILSEKKMENVLVDYHLAQGIAEGQSGVREVSTYRNVQAVFRKHHITEAVFDSSLVYYSIHAEKLSEICRRVSDRVEARAAMMGVEAQAPPKDIYADLDSEGDTANIWADQNFCIMQPNKLQNIFHFHIPADSTFLLGDSFLWRFRSSFRVQGSMREVYFVLLVRYEADPDTVANVAIQLRDSRMNEMRFEPDTHLDTCRIKSISGYAYWPLPETHEEAEFSLLVLSDISLIRFHRKQEEPELEVDENQLLPDSVETDTLPQNAPVRLTPAQRRESQPRERKQRIYRESPVDPSLLRPQQRQQLRRR
ncbi:MAG: DUF4296 domain-containing protein [Bacteroidaceae bacterium]|nr:DUF4296 domain-containing protein [Bacteroidaceae bacterium]